VHDEDAFLKKILEDPADDTPRLAYADWLDEQGDPLSDAKAQFLRLTVRLRLPKRPKCDDAKLQKLAAKLDTDWLAVVSRLKVERCGARRGERRVAAVRQLFSLVCEQSWDEMTPTEDDGVRRCEKCKENVHYCDTLLVARRHAGQGHCVALDLGIIRRPGDLFPQRVLIRGRMLPARVPPNERGLDAVSRERERKKQEEREARAEQE
jgi:uncharacterized protein (TIGR02996 family)